MGPAVGSGSCWEACLLLRVPGCGGVVVGVWLWYGKPLVLLWFCCAVWCGGSGVVLVSWSRLAACVSGRGLGVACCRVLGRHAVVCGLCLAVSWVVVACCCGGGRGLGGGVGGLVVNCIVGASIE